MGGSGQVVAFGLVLEFMEGLVIEEGVRCQELHKLLVLSSCQGVRDTADFLEGEEPFFLAHLLVYALREFAHW